MILAAIWNVWDADELLPLSIRAIHEHVDRVIVVYQTRSNWGEAYEPDLQLAFDLIDDLVRFEPRRHWLPGINESHKRTLGLQRARALGATHFLSMDCDELYDGAQFARARAALATDFADVDVSACALDTYWRPTWRLEPREEYKVPFICRIRDDTTIGASAMPWVVDPSRRVGPWQTARLFDPDELVMHHYSWCRRDIRRKLRNSSARINWPDRVEGFARHWEQWRPYEPVTLPWLAPGTGCVLVADRWGVGQAIREEG